MPINPAIFKAYDIRGLIASEVTEELAERIGRTLVTSGERIVLGYDMRATSPVLAEAVARGVMDAGADVIDVGMISTPTFYFAVRSINCDAGIQVTASHNPAEYNGFKLVRRSGDAVLKVGFGNGMETVRDAVLQWTDAPPAATRGTRRHEEGIVEREVAAALAAVPFPSPPTFRVVADAGNGMGALFLDALFARLPHITLDRLYFELDGTFPNHEANPLKFETLRDLQARVRATHADLGIASDGDGDRVFFVDERGDVVPASLTTAIIATELLREHGGERVLVDIRYQLNARAAVETAGGVTSISRVGHALISEQLRREGGLFAGESSGHYFFRDTGFAESTARAILYVLRALARSGTPMSELAASFRVAAESGEVNFSLSNRKAVATCLDVLRTRYADGERNELDGIAVSYPGWRFNVRASNTEPVLRLNVEGDDVALVDTRRREIAGLIQQCMTSN